MRFSLLGWLSVFLAFSAQAADSRSSFSPPDEIAAPMPPVNEALGRRYTGQWWLETGALGFDEGKDEGTAAALKLAGKLNYHLAPIADIYLDGEMRAYSSRVQARYDDGLYQSGPRIKEFFISVKPIRQLEFRAGALNQKRLRSALLVSEKRSFPGVLEALSFVSEKFSAGISAQQAIPTSYSMNSMREDREKTPTFLTETAEIQMRSNHDIDLDLYTTHFRFNNLPAVVAFESAQFGNSVIGDVAPNSDFRYGFEGFLAGTEICWCMPGPVSLRGGGQWLQNMAAPSRANRAQQLFLGTELRLASIEIKPRYTVFFNESDTTPGYYNGSDVGHNNRKGFAARVDLDFLQYGFQVALEYGESDLINNDPFQAPIKRYFIGVETNHVPF